MVVVSSTTSKCIPSSTLKRATAVGLRGTRRPKKSSLRRFLFPTSFKDFIKRLTQGLVIGTAAAATPATWALVSEIGGVSGWMPKPGLSNHELVMPRDANSVYDLSLSQMDGFDVVKDGFKIAELNTNYLDTNKNGFALDNAGEQEEAIRILQSLSEYTDGDEKEKISDAANELSRLRSLYIALWGGYGPSPSEIDQNDDNCSITADIIGACLTDKNIQQFLKSSVKVVSYSNDDIKVIEVLLNGKTYTVTDKDIELWIKTDKINSPAIRALMYAIEKELEENHVPIPSATINSSSTLLTGEMHYLYPIVFLTDGEIKDAIKQAPGSIIKFGTDNLSYGGAVKGFLGEHTYVVKGWTEEDGEFKVIIKDVNDEYTLTIDEVKEYMQVISIPKDNAPLFNHNSIYAGLLVLGVIAVNLAPKFSTKKE